MRDRIWRVSLQIDKWKILIKKKILKMAFNTLLLYLFCHFFIYRYFIFWKIQSTAPLGIGAAIKHYKLDNLNSETGIFGNCAAGLLFRLIPCIGDIWAGRAIATQLEQPEWWSTLEQRTDYLACSISQPSPPEQQTTTPFRWATEHL